MPWTSQGVLKGATGATGPAGPSAVSTNANNKAALGSDSLTLVQGTAAGVAATTHAQTVSGDDPQLTNARTPTAHEASHVTGTDQIPNASATARGMLAQLSGNQGDYVGGDNTCHNLVTQIQPTIWSARLRSFNAIGNPTFEVDQRVTGGGGLASIPSGVFVQDRWIYLKSGTMVSNGGQVANQKVYYPGTSFRLSNANLYLTNATAQATLGATDYLFIEQQLEGTQLRELIDDVHSIQLLVSTTIVGGLKFTVCLQDPGQTRSLVKLCTIPAANTFTLITLPNLPVCPSAGNFAATPGVIGYRFYLVFACGSNYMAPAADVWQNGNFLGAPGMDNFAATPVNSQVFIGFIQHEPGAQCTVPIDKTFGENLDGNMGCLRYYQKSCPYGVPIVTAGTSGPRIYYAQASSHIYANYPFVKPMAIAPTITPYAYSSNTAGAVRDTTAGVDRAANGAGLANPSEYGFAGFLLNPVNASAAVYYFHYAADTGW